MFTFYMLRMLRRRNYSYQQRRFRFFLIAGFVFLGLYLSDNDDFDETPMIICFVYAGIEILMVLICLIIGQGLARPGDDVIVVEGQVPLTDNYGRPYPNGAGRRGRGMPAANPNYQGADYTYNMNMNNMNNNTNNTNNINSNKPQAKPSQLVQPQPQQHQTTTTANDATPAALNTNPYL